MKKISALALAALLSVSTAAFAGDTKSCDPKSCEKAKSCDKDKKECTKSPEECQKAKSCDKSEKKGE